MRSSSCNLTTGVSVLALAVTISAGALARPIHYPALNGVRVDSNRPLVHMGLYEPPYRAPKKTKSGTWRDVKAALPFTNGPWNPIQLTDGAVLIYTPKGEPQKSWLPMISSVSSTLAIGSTGNAFSGTNFNGFSEGGVVGAAARASTNVPLVRITNGKTGDVCFGRSYDFSTMGVYTSGATNAVFDVPGTCKAGASKLQVIVNGISSQGVAVTLKS